jgi:hypothetical protein
MNAPPPPGPGFYQAGPRRPDLSPRVVGANDPEPTGTIPGMPADSVPAFERSGGTVLDNPECHHFSSDLSS